MDSDDHMHDLDLINIVGTMNNEEKTKYISKFISKKENTHYNIKVLCETSGLGNDGIDSLNVRALYCIYIDPSLLDNTQ